MTRSLIALAVAAALLTSGCAIRGDGRGVAYAVDTGLVVGGAALVAGRDECRESWDFECDVDNAGRTLGGGLMIIGGVVGLLITAAINARATKPPIEAPVVATYARPSDEVPLLPDTALDRCTVAIRDWLRESDAVRKTERYEALPQECRAQITRGPASP